MRHGFRPRRTREVKRLSGCTISGAGSVTIGGAVYPVQSIVVTRIAEGSTDFLRFNTGVIVSFAGVETTTWDVS